MTLEELEAEMVQVRAEIESIKAWAEPVVTSHAPNTPLSAKSSSSDPNSNVMPAYKMLLIELHVA